jgi:response regulator NasT
VTRAKAALMRRYSLDEETAYAMLRRIAMDTRMRIAEVARRIADSA